MSDNTKKSNIERTKELYKLLETETNEEKHLVLLEEMATCLQHDIKEPGTKDALLKVYDNLIDIFYKREDYDKAFDYALKGLEIVNHTKYIHMAGNCKINTQNYKDAEYLFSKLIEVAPKNAPAYMNRGFAKYCQKNAYGAIEDYEKAIELKLNDSKVLYHLAVANHTLERFEKAYNIYSKYIAAEKNTKSETFSMARSVIRIMPDKYKSKLMKKMNAKENAHQGERDF